MPNHDRDNSNDNSNGDSDSDSDSDKPHGYGDEREQTKDAYDEDKLDSDTTYGGTDDITPTGPGKDPESTKACTDSKEDKEKDKDEDEDNGGQGTATTM